MRNAGRLLASGAVLLLVAVGCEPPESTHPLSDPGTAKADPRLNGVFAFGDADGEAWVHLNPRAGSALVDLALIIHDTRDGMMALHYEGFPTKIGTTDYLNLREKTFVDATNAKYTTSASYIFARYEFKKDGSLVLSPMEEDLVKEAIKKGELAGQDSPGGELTSLGTLTGRGVFITADSAKLSAWVGKADRSLFRDLGTFARMPKARKAKTK